MDSQVPVESANLQIVVFKTTRHFWEQDTWGLHDVDTHRDTCTYIYYMTHLISATCPMCNRMWGDYTIYKHTATTAFVFTMGWLRLVGFLKV